MVKIPSITFDAREISARLDNPAIRLLADREESFDPIKETLEHRLKTTGKHPRSNSKFVSIYLHICMCVCASSCRCARINVDVFVLPATELWEECLIYIYMFVCGRIVRV